MKHSNCAVYMIFKLLQCCRNFVFLFHSFICPTVVLTSESWEPFPQGYLTCIERKNNEIYIKMLKSTFHTRFYNKDKTVEIKINIRKCLITFDKINSLGYVRSHTKFRPNQFSHFDVYWTQTDRLTSYVYIYILSVIL